MQEGLLEVNTEIANQAQAIQIQGGSTYLFITGLGIGLMGIMLVEVYVKKLYSEIVVGMMTKEKKIEIEDTFLP